jgi:hypothetical protein
MARAPSNKQFFALWRRLRLPSGQPPTFADFNLNHLGDLAASIAICSRQMLAISSTPISERGLAQHNGAT